MESNKSQKVFLAPKEIQDLKKRESITKGTRGVQKSAPSQGLCSVMSCLGEYSIVKIDSDEIKELFSGDLHFNEYSEWHAIAINPASSKFICPFPRPSSIQVFSLNRNQKLREFRSTSAVSNILWISRDLFLSSTWNGVIEVFSVKRGLLKSADSSKSQRSLSSSTFCWLKPLRSSHVRAGTNYKEELRECQSEMDNQNQRELH